MPEAPEISVSAVDEVLDTIRPFLAVAGGGSIEVVSLIGIKSLQPQLTLKMTGSSASIQSIKLEIMQRIQRSFLSSDLRIEFDCADYGAGAVRPH